MRTTYFWKATHEPEPGDQVVSISQSESAWSGEYRKVSRTDTGLETD